MKKPKILSHVKAGKFLLLFVLCLLSVFAKAQIKFSSEPDKFINEATGLLQTSKSESVLSVATAFKSTWTSFKESQQKNIIGLAQAMVKTKKYRANPHFADLFCILSSAKSQSITEAQEDSLILMLDKSLRKLSNSEFSTLLLTTRLILEKSYLYKSNFNSLTYTDAKFSFTYKEAPAEAPLPGEDLPAEYTAKVETDLDKRKESFFSDWDDTKKTEDAWGTLPADTTPVVENILDVGYAPPMQPALEGPVITFEKVNLIFKTPYDSAVFQETSGSLMLKNNTFVGKGGKFDWTSTGLTASDVYCELKEYNFNIRSSKVVGEGATLHYPSKTDQAVDGIFEFDSKKHKSPEDNQYPRFKSFTNNVNVKGLGNNIKYMGGLAMGGRRVYSSSIDEGYGTIEIMHEGTTRIRSVSNKFELGDSTISADICNIVLFQGDNDSIYHPGTIFKFNQNTETLKLYKQSGFKRAPFIDTYHRVEIVADALSWDLKDSKINFSIINARDQIPATFESEEYFNSNNYASMTGLYSFHPLQMIYGYSERTHSKEFYADDVSKAMKLQPATVRGAMVSLMKSGFIDYNTKNGFIKLRPKAEHYVLSRRNKKDYDNINFISLEPSGNNATLDLSNHELTVRGVEKIYISDSLNVFIIPEGKEVKIMKNRDFKFNGEIYTQNFQFKGKDFLFRYDSFLVHLPTIEAIKLSVKSKDKEEVTKGKSKALGNELAYTSGILYINKPNNKSARKKLSQYPIFDATTSATVSFNKTSIAQGAYDSTMKFKIPPFRLDSLSSDDPSSIGFNGEFDSGGIFPVFKEKLVIMPDFSLGFEHKVPKEGFQLYDGKGKYYNKLTLNNQGLRGDGEIHYLNAVLYSNDFLFLKDSVLAVGSKCINTEGTNAAVGADVKFPDMYVEEYKLKWLPRSDKMFISDTKEPIQFYKNTASLQGTANLTSRGMFGEGILLTRGSESESEKFQFEQTQFSGRDASFQIKSDNPAKPALLCKMVKLEFNLVKNMASFSPEIAGSASNEFPYAMYKSSLDNGLWDLTKKTITMKMPEGGDISRSYFYSTRLDQDSLVFNATEAVYDITQLTLNIKGIPFIKVADGLIIPNENKVFIQENAVMQTLEKAKVVLDTVHEHHHLFDGKIDIRSRLKFEGVATYQYVNLASDTLPIKFTEFKLQEGDKKKEASYTVSTGIVEEDANLRIGPRIFFKGKVTMYAPKKYLSFDGYVKLDLKGELKNSQWLKYYNPGDSSAVVISLENAHADNGSPLSTGIQLSVTDNSLYTTFTSEKQSPSDQSIIEASGFLDYKGEANEFSVASGEKLKDVMKQGNRVIYNDSESILKVEGNFNLLKPDKNIELIATGTGNGDLKRNVFNFNLLTAFNFKMHANIYMALGKSIKQIVQYTEDTSGVEVSEKREASMHYKIMEVAGPSGVEKYKMNKVLSKGSLSSLSSSFANGIVFSDVNLQWSKEQKAFYSQGPIYISNVQKEDISKPTTGFIEIQKTANKDIVTIYLEPMEGAWYYLSYEDNRLAVLAANEDVNKVIDEKSDGEKSDRSKYFVVKAGSDEKVKFLTEFKHKYLGLAHVEKETDDIQEEELPGVGEEKPAKPGKGTEKKANEEDAEEEKEGQTYEVDDSPMKVDKTKGKKFKKKTDFDMDSYKAEEEKPTKEKPTAEDHKESKKDQKKLQDLLGN